MKKGTLWILLGLLLIGAALTLTIYNFSESDRAEGDSAEIVEELVNQLEEIVDDKEEDATAETTPEYILFPEKEMPTIKIGNERYIGYIEIPGLRLKLPVAAGEWTMAKLEKAPCHISGTPYLGNLVIAGHDYRSHFGNLPTLKIGSEIIFTDAEGNVFEYEIGWTEVIKGNDGASMVSGDEEWDLTLYTCTWSGRDRYTVRCYENR